MIVPATATSIVLSSLLAVALSSAVSSTPVQLDDIVSRSIGNSTFNPASGTISLPASIQGGGIYPGDDRLLSFNFEGSEWFDATFGLMLEGEGEGSKMLKRSKTDGDKVTRDLFREEVNLGLDERGLPEWPDNWKGLAKRIVKRATNFKAVITWYTGKDLLNPYCADASGWTPTDNSMIAAVTEKWGPGRPACGSYLQLCTLTGKACIVVRVVDLCGGCAPGVNHVDLSIAAFKKLYALDIGLVKGIKVKTLSGPPVSTKKWTARLKALYGPVHL
ncbi:hypothetical protein T439DRAFT_223550 [Meredithblackwellia eburnea MCA 4105]